MNRPSVPATKTYVAVWLVLLVLLAATFASAYVPLGFGNVAINLAIATAKAALVAAFFMHLRTGRVVNRLAGAAGIFVLIVMVGLTLTDYFTRG